LNLRNFITHKDGSLRKMELTCYPKIEIRFQSVSRPPTRSPWPLSAYWHFLWRRLTRIENGEDAEHFSSLSFDFAIEERNKLSMTHMYKFKRLCTVTASEVQIGSFIHHRPTMVHVTFSVLLPRCRCWAISTGLTDLIGISNSK
jgi:hypothetical protein